MTYIVKLSFQFPAYDEKNGLVYDIDANKKSEAIKRARREAERDGHIPSRGKGRVTFKAIEAE